MITVLKILITLAVVFLLCYPLIPVKGKLGKYFVASSLKIKAPGNRKNAFFILLCLVEFIVAALLFRLFDKIAEFIMGLPLVGYLISNALKGVSSRTHYVVFLIELLIINLLVAYVYIIVKAFLKRIITIPEVRAEKKRKLAEKRKLKKQKKLAKKQKNKKKAPADGEGRPLDGEEKDTTAEDEEAEKLRRRRRIPDFVHTILDDGEEKDEDGKTTPDGKKKKAIGPFKAKILSLFFEGEEFEYALPWVVRARTVLRVFVGLVTVLYGILFFTMVLSLFFPLPEVLYTFLIDGLKIRDWYVYPLFSLLFLTEVGNIFDAPSKDIITPEQKLEQEDEKERSRREARLRALLTELKRRFDKEHSLRYYPEVPNEPLPEYECTEVMYKSALQYIKEHMKRQTGRVLQSHMEFLDAVYQETNTYFAASFYSELGEYLIAYTYIRLLSGARMIYVVSDSAEKDTLRKYISNRLMRLTGSHEAKGWRVYTAEERLEQADVLIACPEDFVNSDIIVQNPLFFEETCNAVFIDADRTINMCGYICPIIATKLQKATDGRIRFIFLTLDLYKGFAAGSLPKYFCVDKVLSFSSAAENEAVSYVLWNKESKSHRIYNKRGQKLTCLETIIAEQAFRYGVDGVRVITDSALEHADREILALHDVEINNFYKDLVNTNYMIYSDERCNLSAALYACTRFRGQEKSVVHILSKPYLLREYFMSRTSVEDFVNRSSFIQPRATDHTERHKLSLVRIFCDAAYSDGIPVEEFGRRMKDAIVTARERNDLISSAYCKSIVKTANIEALTVQELAAYLVAGIYDRDSYSTPEEERACRFASAANRAKDFYLITEPYSVDGNVYKGKNIIFNRVREIFTKLLSCNKRVELRLNDKVIGELDTFPDRVPLEFIEGQGILFDNVEYEIESISGDCGTVYLRRENVTIRNCLDTILLRSYRFDSLEPLENTAVLSNSRSALEDIRVTRCRAVFTATTRGFYSLTTDRQTLDFYRGAEGNPHSEHPGVRQYSDGRVLHVELKTKTECNDGMRLLLCAVFNEFIRTLFPKAYRYVAICPVLETPIDPMETVNRETDSPVARIRSLYPFLCEPTEQFIETDKYRMQFMFINDCRDDVGVLDWFYDRSARYMQEFLGNVYSYLNWLQLRPDKEHYIFFGGKELPECFDLAGLCKLFADFNVLLSDGGKKDIETAGDDLSLDKVEYCSFCHRPMENGRFSFFDKHRFICADCYETVEDEERLMELYLSVKAYLQEHYPEITFGTANAKLDPVYDLTLDQLLSEYNSRVDIDSRTVYVEVDDPVNNGFVSILRGLITLWQIDNKLSNEYSSAQLYYEEILYLRSIGEDVGADWVYANVPSFVREGIDEIAAFVEGKSDVPVENEDTEETEEKESEEKETEKKDATGEHRTSFLFMRTAADLETEEEPEDPEDEEYSDGLYDPNKVPRFWKRYLRGEHIDDGEEDELPEDEEDETEDGEDGTPADDETPEGDTPEEEITESELPEANAPMGDPEEDEISEGEELPTEELPEDDELPIEDGEIPSEDDENLTPAERRKREKEEKKRLLEEKKRKKQQEKEDKRKAKEEEKKAKKERKKAEKDKKKGEDPVDKEDDVKDSEDERQTEKDGKETEKDKEKGADPVDTEDDKKDSEDDGQTEKDRKKAEKEKKKAEKKAPKGEKGKKKPKKKKKGLFSRLSAGERIAPYEEDEKTNPRIRVYNQIVRAAYDYSEERFSREGVTNKELERIFYYVKGDYPELFWLASVQFSAAEFSLVYRCKTPNGKLDIKQIEQKRKELRKGARFFTKGITKKMNPYEALLTIYRRVILTFDYDTVGLNARVDKDVTKDDSLRSLYNALVNHKVVCAGYAAAMQYLLQMVGIVTAYTVSEDVPSEGMCHAFNILKIGKYCYYLDATWGDSSNTTQKSKNEMVDYTYCCVPFKDFVKTIPAHVPYHTPRREFYPDLERFDYTNHEYFRYHKAFLTSYDEGELVRIFADAALAYDPKEMGDFSIAFRCNDTMLAAHVDRLLSSNDKAFELIGKARALLEKRKKKKAAALLDVRSYIKSYKKETGVIAYYFPKSKSE